MILRFAYGEALGVARVAARGGAAVVRGARVAVLENMSAWCLCAATKCSHRRIILAEAKSQKTNTRGDDRVVEENRKRKEQAGRTRRIARQVSKDAEARAIGKWKEGDDGGDGKHDDKASARGQKKQEGRTSVMRKVGASDGREEDV
jgi:hypothetical protein